MTGIAVTERKHREEAKKQKSMVLMMERK